MVIRNKLFACTAICTLLYSSLAAAEMIERNTAQMQAMDKITGRVSVVDVPVNSEVTFGSFSIVVRACKATPPEETPENYAFVDVADSSFGKMQFNIFKGWMMSSSPALNAVEHPIYDVWLLKCLDSNVDKTKLLSAEQLKERDTLPKLADIKQDKEQTVVPAPEVATEVATENETVSTVAEKSPDKVLENYTDPVAAKSDATPVETVPMADVPAEEPSLDNVSDDSASEMVTDSGPQSLLNIPETQATVAEPAETQPEATAPATTEAQINVDETNIIKSDDWVELPPADAKVPAPELVPAVEPALPAAETSVAAPIAEPAPLLAPTSEPVISETPAVNNVENLPEDDEDQFIDLSNEADATAALEAELSAEALKN